jgi:hypothetical protein
MKIKFCLAVFLVLLVNACSLSPKNPPPTEIASIYPNPTSKAPSPIATNLVPLPTPISPLVVTQIVTEAPTGNPVIPPPLSTSTLPIPTTFQFSDDQYMDDRGSEYQFLLSYFNAIRQRLLPMAYYFWNDDPTLAGSYESFVQAHSRLNPDEITVMKAGSSGAAGSIYTTFGVTLKGSKSGVPTSWAGCFTIRTPNPALFDSKDYHSRHFIAERLLEIPVGESPKATLETACAGMDFGMLEISLSNSDSIALVDAKYYVDSRSDPVAIVSSFWNALNRQEYARAYSYFEAPAIFPGPYITFKTGYLDTTNVSGGITAPEKLAATGNWYWKVPVTLNAETKAGLQQAFVGCYIIHQSGPELYVSPSFKPMAIQKAQFETINLSADPATIQAALASACDNLP